MSVDRILGALQSNPGKLGQSLFVQTGSGFADTLTLGQVLKGKVLMHYEGSRYGVSFGGQERIVDSAVPLRSGEIIYGKVVGLGDKVHLKRQIAPEAMAPWLPDSAQARQRASQGPSERLLADLFAQYQVQLPAREYALLLGMMAQSGNPGQTALGGLVVNKLGLGICAEAVQAVVDVIGRGKPAVLQTGANVPELSLDETVGISARGEIATLAGMLQGMLERRDDGSPDEDRFAGGTAGEPCGAMAEGESAGGGGASGGERRDNGATTLGTWILNGQSGGSVAHRITAIPLWFGDRLIEVSAAIFNQRDETSGEGELRHRRIVLALETERLGHVELVATTARQNLRVEVRAARDEATEALAAHLHTLREQLTDLGWTVDGVSYSTLQAAEQGEVVRSVIEHFVTQDSVNQLV